MKIIMTVAIATMTIVTGDKIIIETIVVMDTNMVAMIDMIVVTIAPTIAMIALTIVRIAPTIAMIALMIVMIAPMIVQTIAGVIMIAADDMGVVAIVDEEIVAERDPGSISPKQNICQIITKSIARDKN